MEKVKDLISVVIPAFNHTGDLQRAIKSVLRQTNINFEIVVVDDGSEEDIKSVCDTFSDKRIHYFRNDVHLNADAARNRGIKEAKGDFIAMLDADDEYLPGHLERRLKKIKEWGCDGIFGSAVVFDGTRERVKKSRPLGSNEKMADFLLTDGFCPTPSHFYRAEAVKKIDWDEALYRNQDYDFSIRFSEKFDFRCDPKPTVKVHWYKDRKQKLTDIHFQSQKYFIEKYRDSISGDALVNYFYAMKKEAKDAGNDKAKAFYTGQLKKTAPGIKLPAILLKVRFKVVVNRLKML